MYPRTTLTTLLSGKASEYKSCLSYLSSILKVMPLVETSNQAERQQLEEQFLTIQGAFQVPIRQAQTVATILKSITYQQFHQKVPLPVLKMEQMALRALQGVLSLDLYRQAMSAIQEWQQQSQLFHEYIVQMDKTFEEEAVLSPFLHSSCREQNLKELQLESNRKLERETSILQLKEIPLLPLDSDRSSVPQQTTRQISPSKAKQNNGSSILEAPEIPLLPLSSIRSLSPEDTRSHLTKNTHSTAEKTHKHTLAGFARLSSFFHSPSAVYCREDWETKREIGADASKELESFKKRGLGVLETNSSLKSLIQSQLAYDIKRQVLQGCPLERQAREREVKEHRFNRKMKETLLLSKLSPHRRK